MSAMQSGPQFHQNEEAEASALGAMILSERAIEEVRAICQAESFFIPAHKTIFEAISRVADRGAAVDLVTLRAEIDAMGKLASVGGIDYLVGLCETVPATANAESYAQIVQDRAVRRSVEARAFKLVQLAHGDISASDLVFRASEMFADVQNHLSFDIDSAVDVLSIQADKDEVGISTGLPSLDKVLSCRGYPCGQVSIIQAGTNVGKTPFLTQAAYDCWKRGGRVAYALFADLTPAQGKARLYKLVSGRGTLPRRPDQEDMFADQTEYDAWRSATVELNDPFADQRRFMFYNGRSGAEHSAERFRAWCLKEGRKQPFDLVCVDYLQAVGTSNQRVTMQYERVTHVAQQLNEMAFAMPNTATVVASQVTVKDSGKSVARYGAEAEQDCGFQVEIVREKGAVECALRVQKNRFGDTGLQEGYTFDKQRLRFIDPAQR